MHINVCYSRTISLKSFPPKEAKFNDVRARDREPSSESSKSSIEEARDALREGARVLASLSLPSWVVFCFFAAGTGGGGMEVGEANDEPAGACLGTGTLKGAGSAIAVAVFGFFGRGSLPEPASGTALRFGSAFWPPFFSLGATAFS